MCQMSVLVRGQEQDELVMESVTRLEVKDGGVEVSTFLRNQSLYLEFWCNQLISLVEKCFWNKKKISSKGRSREQ